MFQKTIYKSIISVISVFVVFFFITAFITFINLSKNTYENRVQNHLSSVEKNMNIFMSASQTLNNSISQDSLISSRKDLSFSPYNSIKLLDLLRSATSISYDGFEITAFVDNTKNSYITILGTVSPDYIDSNYGLSKEIISTITNNYNQNNSKKPCFITTTNSDNLKFLMVFFPHYTKSHETYFLVTGFSYDSIFASSSPNFNKNGVTIISMLDDFSICSKDLSENELNSLKAGKTPFMYHLIHEYSTLLNITGKLKFTYISNSFYYYLTILQYIPLLLIFTFLIVLSMFVISKQISKRLYSPLNNIMNKYKLRNEEEIDDEFNLIESHISQLVSSKNTLERSNQSQQQIVFEKFLSDLSKNILSIQEINHFVSLFNLTNTKFPLLIFSIMFRDYTQMTQSFTTSELKQINTSIKTIFTERFSNNDFLKIFETDENIITVIISCPDYDTFKAELLSFVLTIETSFELLLTIIIGGLAQSWHDFQNPCSLLKRLIYTENVKNDYDNNSQIIISEDVDANEISQSFYYSTQTENKLISSIYSNKSDILQQFISDMIFSNPIANSKKNQELLSVMLYSTLVKILTLINKNEEDVTTDDEHIYLEFRKCSTPMEFSDIFTKYYGCIQNFVKDNQIKQTENFKNNMLDYIDKNYQKDISLSSLAEYTNHSQYYISKLFKSVTGENFKDYLSRIRIDKSIEIINQNPGMNVNDIAAAVGLSANTFIKKFQAKTGFTPGTYQSLFSKHNK